MKRTYRRIAVKVFALLAMTVVRAYADPAARAATAKPVVDDATQAMAALLKERAAMVNPANLSFAVNDRRADLLEEQLRGLPMSMVRLDGQVSFATELLRAGRFETALKMLDVVEQDAARYVTPERLKQGRQNTLMLRAMTYMRMAEEQNCCQRSNRDSCLMPIRGEGIHAQKENGVHAIEALTELLAILPDNLEARWLLNIAHMTLGSYPAGVPKALLIPPKVFASEYPLPRFDNVAKEAGVDAFGVSGGAILDDFDNDGRLDLMVSHLGFNEQTRVFWNRGNGTFEDRTEQAGIVGEMGGLNMIQADYDNDGFVDVLILRGGWMGDEGRFPLSLLRNNGNGTFSDVTVAAGLLRFAPTQTAAWLDYDGDGWLDLFVGNESVTSAYPCHLFHNNGNGTFTDVAHEAGVDYVGWVKGVTAGDYDNDGRPDLYLSVQGGDNVLFHNDGRTKNASGKAGWRFTNRAKEAGVTEPKRSFGVMFFDYDNDGWQDLWVSGYSAVSSMAGDVAADYLGLPTDAERGRLFHNEGNGTFKDVTRDVGLYKVIPAMGLNFGDLDNDGFLDVYFGTGNPDLSTLIPKRMFRNDGGKRFQDVTTAGNFGHLQKGHAIVFGDVDNDGDQDVFEQLGGAYITDTAHSALYENPGNTNGWIGLDLVGVHSNRKAIGARIKLTVETKTGPRSFYRVVSSGGSFGGNPLRQQIGVGDALRVSGVEIFWPVTGETQRITGLKLRQWYSIREGDDAAQLLDRPASVKPAPTTPNTSAARARPRPRIAAH